MNSYPNIMYFFHDGSTYLVPHYTNASGLATMLDEVRRAAYLDMTKSGADHAVYAVKHYDPKTGDVVKADIYAPRRSSERSRVYQAHRRTDAGKSRLLYSRAPRQKITTS